MYGVRTNLSVIDRFSAISAGTSMAVLVPPGTNNCKRNFVIFVEVPYREMVDYITQHASFPCSKSTGSVVISVVTKANFDPQYLVEGYGVT